MVKPGDGVRAYKNAIYNTASPCYRANRPAAASDKSVNYGCDFGVCLKAIEEGFLAGPIFKAMSFIRRYLRKM